MLSLYKHLSGRIASALIVGLVLLGCVHSGPNPVPAAPPEPPVTGLTPALPLSQAPAPGLAVVYFLEFYERHLDQLPAGPSALAKGKPGKPIASLDHRFAYQNVFDSGEATGVGMELNGFIRLGATGPYRFRALSNDGIRVYLNDRMILNDPDIHSDRLCGPATVSVTEQGWYPLKVRYFQRKGTAAISLQWQPPGQDDFVPVPAEAYGH